MTVFFACIGLALEVLAVFDLATSGRDGWVIVLLVISAIFLGLALVRSTVLEERRNAERLSDVARLWNDDATRRNS